MNLSEYKLVKENIRRMTYIMDGLQSTHNNEPMILQIQNTRRN